MESTDSAYNVYAFGYAPGANFRDKKGRRERHSVHS